MKGTIIEFLTLAWENPELAKDLLDLAEKYQFEFSDELSDEDLEGVAGGTLSQDRDACREKSDRMKTQFENADATYQQAMSLYSLIQGTIKSLPKSP